MVASTFHARREFLSLFFTPYGKLDVKSNYFICLFMINFQLQWLLWSPVMYCHVILKGFKLISVEHFLISKTSKPQCKCSNLKFLIQYFVEKG